MNGFSRLIFVLKEGFRQLIRSKGLSVAVIVVVAGTLFQLSVFLGISKVMESALRSASEKFEMVLFLSPDAQLSDRQRLESLLAADPRVASVKVVTKEEAVQEFRKDPDIDQMLQALGENPLTDSFSVILKKDAGGNLDDLVEKLKKDPQIEEVNYGKGEWETVSSLTRTFRWVGFSLGGLIFFTSLFIVSNTLAIALWARREDLILVSRMGAPAWMRWGPYLFEGLCQGFLGSIPVVLILEAARHGLSPLLQKVGGFEALFEMPDGEWWSLYLTLVLLGLILGSLGALLALQKKWVKELQ
jgi:cell division transport system permease protein